jgi:prepilin-type N-terminal cleavage/methylation domain-containing protein
MRKIAYFSSGFTMIEILVTIVVVLIIAGLTFAGYASLNERQKLISAGQTMKNVIRDAQSRAFNGEMDCNLGVCDCSVSSTEKLVGWYVDLTNRQIYGQCDSTSFPDPPQSFSFADEIIITPYLTPVSSQPIRLLFQSSPPSSQSVGTLCISNRNLSSYFYPVRLNRAGMVSDEGGLVETCP